MSNSSWMPVPRAVISAWTSLFLQDPVDAGLLDVEDLAADREDRLVLRVAAALGRAARRVALDDVDLALLRVGRLAVGQLARQSDVDSSRLLRRVRSRAWRAAMRARAACGGLADDRPWPRPGCASNQSRRCSLQAFWTNDLASVLPSLVLVWPSNCGSASFTEMIAVRPSRMSSPVRLSSLPSRRSFCSRAYRLTIGRQRGAEALFVGAALGRVDGVGEGVDRLGVGAVPLHGDLDGDALAVSSSKAMTEAWTGLLLGVEVRTKSRQPALVVVGDDLGLAVDVLGPLVAHGDRQALVEEGHLLEPPARASRSSTWWSRRWSRPART